MKSSSINNNKDLGVLILAYGGGTKWNKTLQQAIEPFKKKYTVEIAFGMANYVSLYKGVQALEKKQVNKIIGIQLFISSYSPIIEQNEYLLGKRDELPATPLPLMQHIEEFKEMMKIGTDEPIESSHSGEHGHHGMYMPKDLQPVPLNSEIILTPAMDDHPVVAQILHQRIQELSSQPKNETILLVAHGPINEDYNRQWVLTMENLARQIQSNQTENGTAYKQIFCITVRDDAPEPVYEQATSNLRAITRQAGQTGDVIVTPLFLSPGGREKAIAHRLKGLDFKWNGKTLLPDSLLLEYLQSRVEEALSGESL